MWTHVVPLVLDHQMGDVFLPMDVYRLCWSVNPANELIRYPKQLVAIRQILLGGKTFDNG